MKKLGLFGSFCVLLIVLSIVCFADAKAPLNKDGSKQLMIYKGDGGIDLLDAKAQNYKDQVKQREQLAGEIEQQIKDMFGWFEYDLKNVKDLNGGEVPKGALVMTYKVTDYDAGNAAARYFVGFGAGHCHMTALITVERDGEKLFSKEYTDKSSIDWKKIIDTTLRKFNEDFTPMLSK